METMRDLLRAHVGRSLRALTELDRLAAAWPLVCGAAMAAHGAVTGYDDAAVTVQVSDPKWMRQMMAMQAQIAGELARVAGVPVAAIHFERSTTYRG